MNKRTRSNNKSNINNIVIKKKAKLRPVHKSSSKLNTSKGSKTGLSNLSVSRSVPSLPIIAGNDLKTIKEIFTRAKKFKEKYGRQKIPVKVMMAGKYSSMGHLRVSRSIPKYRKSQHSTVGNLSKIYKTNEHDSDHSNFTYQKQTEEELKVPLNSNFAHLKSACVELTEFDVCDQSSVSESNQKKKINDLTFETFYNYAKQSIVKILNKPFDLPI